MNPRSREIFKKIALVFVAGTIAIFLVLAAISFKKNRDEEFEISPISIPENATNPDEGVPAGTPFPIEFAADFAFCFDENLSFVFELPEGLEVIEKSFPKSKFSWIHRRSRGEILLVAFNEGEFRNAKMKVRAVFSGTTRFVEKEILLPEIFAVVPKVAPEAELELAAERKIVPEASSKFWIFAGTLAAFAAAIFAAIALKRRSRAKFVAETPPWIVAENSLDSLKIAVSDGKISAIFAVGKLSDIVRNYLAKRFCVAADAMTTPEFFAEMKREKSPLSSEHKTFLKDFLSDAELVKFAGVDAHEGQVFSAISRAKILVEETIPVPESGVPENENSAENRLNKGNSR